MSMFLLVWYGMVAIKIIDRSKLKEDYQKDHLHREARILGQLRHPNIIRLYETLKRTQFPTDWILFPKRDYFALFSSKSRVWKKRG
nr:hypothetical protein BaRGS_031531 [Batillaria attramentaria]